MCFDSDDKGHLCDVCNESLCHDGNDSDCLCDLCGEHACTNPDHSHLLPVIKVYADGDDCTDYIVLLLQKLPHLITGNPFSYSSHIQLHAFR